MQAAYYCMQNPECTGTCKTITSLNKICVQIEHCLSDLLSARPHAQDFWLHVDSITKDIKTMVQLDPLFLLLVLRFDSYRFSAFSTFEVSSIQIQCSFASLQIVN